MYKNNKIDGMRNTYYSGGTLWSKEIYTDGRMLMKFEFDEEGFIIAQETY